MSKFTIHSFQNVKPLFEIKIFIMPRPIKNTPVLKGKDAINFYAHLAANRDKKVDKERIEAVQKAARLFNAILKK